MLHKQIFLSSSFACIAGRIAGLLNEPFTTGRNFVTVCWYTLLTFFLFLSFRIVLMDDAIDCLMTFSDFVYAFQLQFYYQGITIV